MVGDQKLKQTPHAPKQPRSKRTLGQILAATEELLESREFEDISIDEIAKRAGVAVGTVYTRFKSKDDLLPYLISRLQDEQLKMAPLALDAKNWAGQDLTARVTWQIKGSAHQLQTRRKGLVRAILRRQFSENAGLPTKELEKSKRLQSYVVDWLMQCRDEITHPHPELATQMAAFLMTSPLYLRILFADPITASISVEDFAEELIRAVLSYLIPTANPGGSRHG